MGTALSVQFSARLPQGAADGSPTRALEAARGTGGAVHTEVLSAYTDAVALAYRVAAVVIVLLAAAVAAGLRKERRS
ncbi:hypothetical protein ACFQ6V_25700 [Streptomyces roseifaciens]